MNGAYVHILLNHFPFIGMFFSVAFLVVAGITRNETVHKSALYLLIFTALMTIPTYLTGRLAEEVIDHLPTFSEKIVSAHEKFAEKAAWLIWITGIFAFIQLILVQKEKKAPVWLASLIFLLSVVSLAAAGWTNKLGGQISHVELREGGAMNAGDKDEIETDRN